MKHLHLAFALLLVAVPVLAKDDHRLPITVGPLTIYSLMEGDFEYGCGMSAYTLSRAGHLGTLVAEWPAGEGLLMFADGHLMSLPVLKDFGTAPNKVGGVHSVKFGTSDRSATFLLKTAWVCPKGSESCEVTKYEGTLELTSGSQSGKIPVHVEYGC